METPQKKVNHELRNHLYINTAKAIFFTAMLAFLVIGYLNYHGIYPAETSLWLICLTCTLIFRFIISVIAQKYPDKNIYYVLLISSGFLLGGLLGGFYWSFFMK